jgi:hypothetical protein
MSDKIRMDWLVNGLLAVILVLLVGNYVANHQVQSARADNTGWATDGIMVNSTTGQAERLVVVDTKKQNIMIYHSRAGGQFALSGARSYKYDVELVDTAIHHIPGNGWTFLDAKQVYDNAQK